MNPQPASVVSSEVTRCPKAREKLPKEQEAKLKKQEHIIALGFVHMRDCAEAFRVIRDEKLYRAQCDTFAEYCAEKWGRERQTVDLMLQAYELRSEFDKNFVKMETAKALLADTSDSAIRTLGKIEPEKREDVFQLAAEASNGAPTAKAIELAAQREQKIDHSLVLARSH